MVTKPNPILEYSIDSLLKAFNTYRKPVLNHSHFSKLMNLLDTRLRKQGIDMELPGYWYKYGFYIEPRFLDSALPRKFTEYYTLDDTVVPPMHPKRDYGLKADIKKTIDSIVRYLWKQYGYKSDYGKKVKSDSYQINSPYDFNTIFQDYIDVVNRKERGFGSRKDQLESLLDDLLNNFPEDDFPELFDLYLEWDDTVRLILDCISSEKQYSLIVDLRDKFWDVFSEGVRIIHHQNIPDEKSIIDEWERKYEQSIPAFYHELEDLREEILSDNYEFSDKNEDTVKKLLKCAYENHKGEAHG
jgi:hypothetical protein